MATEQTPISRALSDILTGYYSRKRLTQEKVAARAEMSVVTLQKKLKAKAPITATDLVVLSEAIGVDPRKVLDEALEEVARHAGDTRPDDLDSVSEAPLSLDDTRRRKQEEIARMSTDEIEGQQLRAAIHDEELETDET